MNLTSHALRTLLAFAVWVSPMLSAQSRFEVASVKPSNTDVRGVKMQFTPGGGVTIVNASLKQIILMAYDVERFQVSGGPNWIDSDRFDIVATASSDTDLNETRQRLQTLLRDRFQLTVHTETKEGSVYALAPAKGGAKLRASVEGFEGISARPGTWVAERAEIGALVHMLSGYLARPVNDETGLKATYAFKLEWTPDMGGVNPEKAEAAGAAPVDPTGPSIFSALQEQLGLKLESRKGPIENIIIDRAERPLPNAG